MNILKANGVELAFDSFGDESAEPILLIDGLGTHMIRWTVSFCQELASRGYRVIRFSNIDVMTNLEGVLLTIASAIAPSPLPTSDGSAMLPAWPKQRGALFTRRSPEGERAKL